MKDTGSKRLFNLIAPVYGLFYRSQKKHYKDLIRRYDSQLHLSDYETALDIGCGTGALCSALREHGLNVTGVDVAENMIGIASSKKENQDIDFHVADVLQGLPYVDNGFDLVIASYVLHGLESADRMRIYQEMNRIADKLVIIHDYNENRKLFTSIIEYFEGGDYFSFIKVAEQEMKMVFSEIMIIEVGEMSNWYVCNVKENK